MQFSDVLDTLAGVLDDRSISCANADQDWCGKGEAKWRAHIKCPECESHDWALWCSPCKDLVIATEDGFECAQCGALVFPARRFVVEFLPLEK